MKILKLLLGLGIFIIIWCFLMWFCAIVVSSEKLGSIIFVAGIFGLPLTVNWLAKIFNLKIENNNNDLDILEDSDYGDAHYDSAYSMMSGNIYHSDDE